MFFFRQFLVLLISFLIYIAQNRQFSVNKCHPSQAFKVKLCLPHEEITFNMTKKTPYIKDPLVPSGNFVV